MPAITKQFYLLATICLLTATASQAQLKIGTNPTAINAASLLEMESTNKGLVLPRVSLTALATAAPLDASLLEGTLVYNTNATLPGGVGIYLWRTGGLGWLRLPFAANAGVTLNDAYNFGGAGAGRTITADAGAVKIDGTDGLLVTGFHGSGADIEVGGHGARMLFNPQKAAFRAGYVGGDMWNNIYVGEYSVAIGNSPRASGSNTVALGFSAWATADHAVAIGANSFANGLRSMAMGSNSQATNDNAVAIGTSASATAYQAVSIGTNNQATGVYSMAMGYNSTASGDNATTTGYNNEASGSNSIAMGHTSIASGQSTMASGHYVQAKSYGSATLGAYNDITDAPDGGTATNTDRLFQIGNGSADNARSNALTMLRNGRTGFSTVTPNATLHVAGTDGLLVTGTISSGADIEVSGSGSRLFFNPKNAAFRAGFASGNDWDNANIGLASAAMGFGTKASGEYSFAVGNGSQATNQYAVAMGRNVTASGIASTATGMNSVAQGNYSFATGINSVATGHNSLVAGKENLASGENSLAMGNNNIASANSSMAMGNSNIVSGRSAVAMGDTSVASGNSSMAMGQRVLAKSYGGMAIGSFNNTLDAPSASIPAATDRIFQVGNGSAANARSNALTMLRNGRTGLSTVTPLATLHVAGADGLLVTGIQGSGASIEASGEGTRMFFNPKKGAFRAGYVEDNEWDNTNVGLFSIALGYNVKASNTSTFAVGEGSLASAYGSVAIGNYNTSSGEFATALGLYSETTADGAFAVGLDAKARNKYAVAMGSRVIASGQGSFATGFMSEASGEYSLAMGETTIAAGRAAISIGSNTNASADYSIAMGQARASGVNSIAMGDGGTASTADNAVAIGGSAKATAVNATALGGYRNTASGTNSVVMGNNSTAGGNTALAMGNYTSASGDHAIALGNNLFSRSVGSTAVGQYNDNGDNPSTSAAAGTDRIFQIGNGEQINRTNAVTVLRNGNTGIGVTNPSRHKLEINGSVRQTAYSQSVSIAANGGTNFIWTHNLGYQPIIMLTLDQTGGGYLDWCTLAYTHLDNNRIQVYVANRNTGNTASGNVRWIVVY